MLLGLNEWICIDAASLRPEVLMYRDVLEFQYWEWYNLFNHLDVISKLRRILWHVANIWKKNCWGTQFPTALLVIWFIDHWRSWNGMLIFLWIANEALRWTADTLHLRSRQGHRLLTEVSQTLANSKLYACVIKSHKRGGFDYSFISSSQRRFISII